MLPLLVGQGRGVEHLRDALAALHLDQQRPAAAGGQRQRQRRGDRRLPGAALARHDVEADRGQRGRPAGGMHRTSLCGGGATGRFERVRPWLQCPHEYPRPHGHPVGVPHGSPADPQHQGHPRQLRPRRLGAGLGDLGHERPSSSWPGSSARSRADDLPVRAAARARAHAAVGGDARRVRTCPPDAPASLVFTAGQLPFVDGALAATGKVGAEVSAEQANGPRADLRAQRPRRGRRAGRSRRGRGRGEGRGLRRVGARVHAASPE